MASETGTESENVSEKQMEIVTPALTSGALCHQSNVNLSYPQAHRYLLVVDAYRGIYQDFVVEEEAGSENLESFDAQIPSMEHVSWDLWGRVRVLPAHDV